MDYPLELALLHSFNFLSLFQFLYLDFPSGFAGYI